MLHFCWNITEIRKLGQREWTCPLFVFLHHEKGLFSLEVEFQNHPIRVRLHKLPVFLSLRF